jgi:hypothetical protein
MVLDWSKNLFVHLKKFHKNNIIGHDIFAYSRVEGKFIIFNGICISIYSGKFSFLATSLSLKRIENDTTFFINFPLYLNGTSDFKIIGLTYGFKINCSKLVRSRFKN